jgi:hypothetical protein
MRLNFKVGYMICKGGMLQWQQCRDLRNISGNIQSPMTKILRNESVDKVSMTTASKRSDRYSVITPSLAQFTRAASNTRGFANASNPNPSGR